MSAPSVALAWVLVLLSEPASTLALLLETGWASELSSSFVSGEASPPVEVLGNSPLRNLELLQTSQGIHSIFTAQKVDRNQQSRSQRWKQVRLSGQEQGR